MDQAIREQRRKKALKLLEALVEPHENVKTDSDHEWRHCRTCLAREELDNPKALALLRDLLAALEAQTPQWQPIETAPREEEVFFWIVPKTAEESYTDTSGRSICSTAPPYLHRGKWKTWNSLSKATHWMPLPARPPSKETP